MAEVKDTKTKEKEDLVRRLNRVDLDFEEFYVNDPMMAGSLPEGVIKTLKSRFEKE